MKVVKNKFYFLLLVLCVITFFFGDYQLHSQPLPEKQTTELAQSFDLRQFNGENYVTSIRLQLGGTCWTHGVIAAIESNLLITGEWKKNGETGEPNLAEYHLDWWNGFNQYNNDDYVPNSENGLKVHNGGDYRVASAYLTRGDGAVRQVDGQSFDTPPKRTDPNFHFYYVRNIEWYIADKPHIVERLTIKKAIMTHGAVGTAMCYKNEFMNKEFVHYQPPSDTNEPNHAIAIVGWDNNKKTQSPYPGAWLCKNSWDSAWGLDGYFWISYDDKVCGKHPEMGAVSFQNVELNRYNRIYYHDYHGWRDTMTDCREAFNCFSALSDEYLKAVSFFTAVDFVDYYIKVYKQFDGYELTDEVANLSGTIGKRGFHTIDFDVAVPLYMGEYFYIYLDLSDGGHPYDRSSEVPVLLGAEYFGNLVESSSQPGQSYYLSDSGWVDLYEVDLSPWPKKTANFCIKGLTIFNDPSQHFYDHGKIPADHTLFQNYPNPFNHTTNITYFLSAPSRVVLKILNLQGREIITLIDQIQSPGIRTVTWNGKDQDNRIVSSGIYIASCCIDNTLLIRKMILMK